MLLLMEEKFYQHEMAEQEKEVLENLECTIYIASLPDKSKLQTLEYCLISKFLLRSHYSFIFESEVD